MSEASKEAKLLAKELTLAVIAKADLSVCSKGNGTPSSQGQALANMVNSIYNGILANVEKKA